MKSLKMISVGFVATLFVATIVLVAAPSAVIADEWSGDWGGDWSGDASDNYFGDWSGDASGNYYGDWSGDYGGDWSGDYGGDWSGDYGCGYGCGDWSGDYGCDYSCGDWSGDYGCDSYCGDYDYDYECGCYDYDGDYDYDEYYEETYYDEGCDCYSYSSPSYSSGGSKGFSIPSFSSSGFSYAKPMTFSSPSYPVYNPPAKATGGNSSVSNVTNTTITNVDNSINDSFNNYNSGNTIISTAPLAYATPQYPIVYTHPAPYCQIYQASSASGYGVNSVYLSWTSSNASSAYLSNVGSVNVNGSTTVWPTHSTTYTLTVYGSNGQSAQCQVAVNAYSAPYVSLTQIPYTGFDFGTIGNAMYWLGLAVFALGAGYLAVYYLPRTVLGKAGIPAVAFAGVRTRKYAPVVAAKAPILVEKEAAEVKVAPIVNAIRKAGTLDSMAIVDRKDGSMPKIVISRD